MQKITLETLYTPYTLDLYQTFTFEMVEEYVTADTENGGDYDDFEWEYDSKGYLEALAENLVSLLNENILDDVILKVEQDGKPVSPQYYNFTTDKAWVVFTVSGEKLNAWIAEHDAEYQAGKLRDRDGFWWFGDENETMLAYYLKTVSAGKYSHEEYFFDQLEQVDTHEYVEAKKIIS